ncbi:MAG: hypothetical protein K1X88_36275 [Nannocystaceae bacterium]|nr:hypothetical protein [Nannocystaceae bacterium]
MTQTPGRLLLVVPTRARLAEAQRVLLGFDRVAQRHGHTLHFAVVDDAADASDVAWDPSLRGRLRYYGAAARAALLDALVAAGCDRELLEFGLGDPWGFGLSPGANRNVVQLLTQGQRVLTVDDDIEPRLALPPQRTDEPQVRRDDASEFWFFRDAREGHAFVDEDADPIAAITAGFDIDPGVGAPPVCASWLGMSGDGGSPNGLYWLVQHGPSRERLMVDYEAMRASTRLMRSVTRPTVTFGAAWTPAVVAYDHTRLLPPFLPMLRGQGLVWGATVSVGGAWSLVRMPGALEHRMDEPRAVDPELALRSIASMATAAFVQLALGRAAEPSAAIEPAAALATAAARLREITRDTKTFTVFARNLVATRCRALVGNLDALRERHRGQPASWAADVAAARVALLWQRDDAASWVPYDLADRDDGGEVLRRVTQRFAELLRAWPQIVDAARACELAPLGVID